MPVTAPDATPAATGHRGEAMTPPDYAETDLRNDGSGTGH